MRFFRWLYNQPYLLLFLTTLFWAGNAVAGKLAVGHISPFLLTSLRWLVATLLVMPLAYKYLRQDWVLARRNLLFLFVLGAIGFSLFNNLMYTALQTTTAVNAAIIQAALPVVIFGLNFIVYRISVNKDQLMGFTITVIGVIVVVAKGQWQLLSSLEFVAGDVLMLFAITSYGIYSVMLIRKPAIHWLSLIAILSISAFLASLPFVASELIDHSVIIPDLTAWLVVLYTALFASLCAQMFWIRGIELVGANATSVFINLVPILATLLAILILDEPLYWYHVLGLILITGGIALSQKNITG